MTHKERILCYVDVDPSSLSVDEKVGKDKA